MILGGFMIFLMLLVFLTILFLVVFWVWTIVDAIKRNFENDSERLVWVLLFVLLGIIPSIVYYFVVMRPNNNGVMKKTVKKEIVKKSKKKRK
jgi:beta-lactamase regulating signal transducer with metallopeptidase domain